MKEYDVVLARADVDGNCRVIPREGVERSAGNFSFANTTARNVIPREGVESMIEAFREPPKRTICDPERGS